MMVFGVFMTPVLPSANGRVGLVGPIMVDMLGTLEYKKGGKAATMIANATFTGFTLFASVFLTSKPINFVVYGLLPAQVQEEFQWGGWLTAAAVSGLVMFSLVLIYLLVVGRSDEKPNLSLHHINAQLQMLGPLTNMEWTALIAVFVFILGTAISSVHKVDPPWIALAVLTLLLALDALQKKEFHEKVDWSFILYLAGLIGLVKTMSSVGIDAMIARNLSSVGDLMRADFGMFVVKLFFTMTLVRLIVPNNATIAMFCTILLPMAQVNGVNPWVIGYIILTFSDGWLFPFQCTYYLLFLEITESSGYYERKQMLKFQVLTNVFRVAAIFASIPYWRWLGIIG
jgi:DASS family divalent anion:Na+ symporter